MLEKLRERIDPNLKAHHWKHTEYGSPHPKGFDWKDLEGARSEVIREILRIRGK